MARKGDDLNDPYYRFLKGENDVLCVHPVFVRLCLFHSLNRPFQSHPIVILALQRRRGRSARPPLNIRCKEPVTF